MPAERIADVDASLSIPWEREKASHETTESLVTPECETTFFH